MEKLKRIRIPASLKYILRIIKGAGHECYIIGGATRDALLKRPVHDWDLASNASPTQLIRLFKKVIPIGIDHGTVAIIHEKKQYEITSYRSRKPGSFGKTIEEDLALRDFTINAIAYDPFVPSLKDPFEGVKDLQKKIIRSVGDATKRFREDPLRTLRAIRLASELEFRLQAKTLDPITKFSAKVKRLPAERVRNELIKILKAQRPSLGIELMRKTGLLGAILPELLDGYRMKQNPQYHAYHIYKHSIMTMGNLPRDHVLRLAGLLHDIGKPAARKKLKGQFRFWGHENVGEEMADSILKRLRFSNKERQCVTHLVKNHMLHYKEDWTDSAVKRLLARLGKDRLDDFFLLFQADKKATGKEERKGSLLKQLKKRIHQVQSKKEAIKTTDLKINGHDIISLLGIKPGKRVGDILNALLEMVLENPEKNTRKKLKEAVATFAQQ